jgi:alanyl-tRNA synthetase
MDEELAEPATVKTLTAKEMKKLAKPEFEANPELFYPTKVFEKYGYSRFQCIKCGAYFWRHSEDVLTCGDSNCTGTYSFIGKGTGKGTRGEKITYAEAWEGFKKVLTTTENPCTAIDRYPVVARWRNDVEYVAAGIYCFQPYCVTGEMEAPANPLICPQFCVRFNDLDNIGLTGRHYSGFIMLGI